MIKLPNDMTEAGAGTLNALAKSGTAFAEGFGAISQHLLTVGKQSAETNLAAGKEATQIRNAGDWVELHSRWTGDVVNMAVAHANHFNKLSAKLFNDACEPLKVHFSDLFTKGD